MILIVAVEDRKMRIEVGYGLDGVITDALSSRIIRETITPRFRANDYPGGIEAGADAIIEQLQAPPEAAEQRALEAAQAEAGSSQGSSFWPLFFWLVVLGFIFIPMLIRGFTGRKYRGRRGRTGPVVIWGPGLGSSGWGSGSSSSWGGGSSSWGGGGGGFSGCGARSAGGGAGMMVLAPKRHALVGDAVARVERASAGEIVTNRRAALRAITMSASISVAAMLFVPAFCLSRERRGLGRDPAARLEFGTHPQMAICLSFARWPLFSWSCATRWRMPLRRR